MQNGIGVFRIAWRRRGLWIGMIRSTMLLSESHSSEKRGGRVKIKRRWAIKRSLIMASRWLACELTNLSRANQALKIKWKNKFRARPRLKPGFQPKNPLACAPKNNDNLSCGYCNISILFCSYLCFIGLYSTLTAWSTQVFYPFFISVPCARCNLSFGNMDLHVQIFSAQLFWMERDRHCHSRDNVGCH